MRSFFKKGQSLLELIIALAIFSIIVISIATTSLGGYTGLIRGGEYLRASAFSQEGIEAIRSIRDRAWNELIYSGGATAGIEISGNQWILNNLIHVFC